MTIVLRKARSRLSRIAMAFAFAGVGFSSSASAASPAEDFVQQNIAHGLSILNISSGPKDRRAADFGSFLESLTDFRRVALFTLGDAATRLPSNDIDDFVSAFHDYAVAEYQSQLSGYSGGSLVVAGSTERAPGDFVVRTEMADAAGHVSGNATEIDFRVSNRDGKFVILDAGVSGVWLAIAERDQFTTFLAQNHNDLVALTAHVRQATANLRA